MILHSYWRSTASYRIRIALNIKGIAYHQQTHDLRSGEHRSMAYRALNAQGFVPALEADNDVFTQSSAIIEWLEEQYPAVPLLPTGLSARAVVRAMAAIVSCDVHPLNNLRVLTVLRQDLAADEATISEWIARWISDGFETLELLISRYGDGFAFGASPSMADCFLVPQVYSAERFAVDVGRFPNLMAAANAARALPPFAMAHPDRQPDADPG